MDGHDLHAIFVNTRTGSGDGLGWNGLISKARHEGVDSIDAAVALIDAFSRIEERDHRIEIVVGGGGAGESRRT
jgi:hypothetical protein